MVMNFVSSYQVVESFGINVNIIETFDVMIYFCIKLEARFMLLIKLLLPTTRGENTERDSRGQISSEAVQSIVNFASNLVHTAQKESSRGLDHTVVSAQPSQIPPSEF